LYPSIRAPQAGASPDRGVDPKRTAQDDVDMNSPPQHSVDAALDQIESRLQALMRLRFQMLKAHARLEYFRLMLRLQRR
jgi:hypothetical protein